MSPLPGSPILSRAGSELLEQIDVVNESGLARAIYVPAEKPLTVWFDGRELVTLMTLGAAPEWLVMGYLRNQRLVNDVTDVESILVDWELGTARVQSRDGVGVLSAVDIPGAHPACALGTAFGPVMRNEPGIDLPAVEAARISRTTLLSILESMRAHDDIHRAAGSVHSCAVFRSAELMVSVEDISRHNGVDTMTGWMALHGVSGADKTLFTTGRLTGEMVMKAALNGVPILVTRNGVTAMGRELALRFGMTLIGRAANRRFVCFAGLERLDAAI